MFKKLGLSAAMLAALALPTTVFAQHGREEHRGGHVEHRGYYHGYHGGPRFGIYFGPGPVYGPYYGPYGGGYYDAFGIWHPYGY